MLRSPESVEEVVVFFVIYPPSLHFQEDEVPLSYYKLKLKDYEQY